MRNYLELPQYLEFVGSTWSLFFNIFLLYLIRTYSRPEYGSYRILMMVLTGLYVIYSAIEIITLPSYYVYEYNYLLFTTNFVEYQKLSQFLIVTFCAIFGCMQVVLAVQFVYRFLSVTGKSKLRERFFRGKRHVVWITCTFLFFLNWFLVAWHVFANNGDHPKELAEAVNERFGRNISQMAFTLVTYAQSNDRGVVEPNYLDIGMIFYLIVCASIPMTISLFCGVRTWLEIHNTAALVQKSFRLQRQERQLFFALLLQFSVPFLGNTVPMLILFVCPALHVSTEPYTNFICMLVPFYPVFDAIATTFVIKDYYRGMMKTLGLSQYAPHSSSSAAAHVPPNSMFTHTSTPNPVNIEMAPLQFSGQ